MPIYDIFATKEQEQTVEPETEVLSSGKDRFFSSLTARVLFFLLLIGDVCWGVYALFLVLLVKSSDRRQSTIFGSSPEEELDFSEEVGHLRRFAFHFSFQPRARHHDRLYVLYDVR
jgi:hypothetical protein